MSGKMDDLMKDIEREREELSDIVRSVQRDNDGYEEYLYNRRMELVKTINSYREDPRIAELYEERLKLINKMENDFYDFKDDFSDHIRMKNNELDLQEEELIRNYKKDNNVDGE